MKRRASSERTEKKRKAAKRQRTLLFDEFNEEEGSSSSSSSSSLHVSFSIDDSNEDDNDQRRQSSAEDTKKTAKKSPPRTQRLKRKIDKEKEALLPPSFEAENEPDEEKEEEEEGREEEGSESDALYDSIDEEGEMDSFIVSDDDSSLSNELSEEEDEEEDEEEEESDESSSESSLDLMDIELDDADANSKPEKKTKKKKKKGRKKKPKKEREPATNLDELAMQLADILPWDESGHAPDEVAKKLVTGETATERIKVRQKKLEKSKGVNSKNSSAKKNAIESANNSLRDEWRDFVTERDTARDAECETVAEKDRRFRKHLNYLKKTAHNAIGMVDRPNNRPYFHQLSALAWAMLREIIPYKGVRGGLFSDDMGVGKTALTLMLIAMDRINGYYTVPSASVGVGGDIQYRAPTLVCCPNSLLSTWSDEAKLRFDPRRLNMIVLHDSHTHNWRNNLSVELMSETDVLVINYEGLSNIYKELRDELLMDIRTYPRRYSKWLNETDDDINADIDDDVDDIIGDASPSANGQQQQQQQGEDRLKRSEFDRKAKRLVASNLQIGFRTIWKDTRKWKPKHFIYGWGFLRLVLDECTQVKNDETLRFASVHAVNAQRRWGISGTPLENHIDELYSLLVILGVDREAHSVRDKLHWHRLVTSESGSRFASSSSSSSDGPHGSSSGSLLVPDANVVRKLKRRFLNVPSLRREIQNINAINPLGAYVKRALCPPEEAALWDLFVSTRTTVKRERAIRRHQHQRSRRSMGTQLDNTSDSWWTSSLVDLTLHQLKHAENAKPVDIAAMMKMVQETPEGFYWYTSQRQFLSAYKHVDVWMQEAFDISLFAISEAGEAARDYMRKAGISVPTTTEHSTGIREAILGGIRKHAVDADHITPVTILGNFPIPKPLLFVAEAHELEKAVYDDARSIAQQLTQEPVANATPTTTISYHRDSQNNQNVAFRCITRCRTACLDYRSARNAAPFLTQQRGTLWDEDGQEPFDLIDVPTSSEEAASGSIGAMIGGASGSGKDVLGGDDDDDGKKEYELFKAAELKEQRHDKNVADARKDKLQSVPMPRRVPTKYLMYLRYIKAVPKTDKLIFFTDLISYLPRLKRFFEENGVRTVTLVGGMHGATRDEVINQFNRKSEDSPRLLLASLKCANMGLNLQIACHVLMGPPSWNGAVEEQAKRRVLRIGQDQDVFFVYFVLLNTIEELVLARGGEKSDMITTVVGNDDGVVKTGSNFTRPDVNQAHLMTFEQGTYGPIIPSSPEERLWPETSVADLEQLPLATIGTNFARITTASLLSERGTIDRTKLARALYIAS